jgi:ParB-like chromosome segregation protein Spo0J
MRRKASKRRTADIRRARPSRSLEAGTAPPISVLYRPIEDRLDPANARRHSKKQIKQIATSIETFGFNVPVLVDAERKVIAGHGRLLACQQLGWTEVPTISLTHLTEAQTRAFAIADNRLSEIATWDDRLLAEELKQLSLMELDFDLELTGFGIGEIDLRIGTLASESGGVEPPIEAMPQPAAGRSVSKKGDVWLLGEHRIRCCNALGSEADQALMGAERATLIFTDNPACVDAIIQRWQGLTGKSARHAESGQCFNDRIDPTEAVDAS